MFFSDFSYHAEVSVLKILSTSPMQRASHVLIPNVLDTVEPKLASSIREFAKTLPRAALQVCQTIHVLLGYANSSRVQ